MTLGFLFGSKYFFKLFSVSWEVFIFTWVGLDPLRSQVCTTTAYRWLCRDSHPSPRTLWSAVSKSPKISALGTTVPVRLLHESLVIFVLQQISQFRSFGKWVKKKCCVYSVPLLLAGSQVIHEKNWKCFDVLEHFHQPVHAWTPVANLAHLANHHSVILRRHFLCEFSTSADLCKGSPRANDSSFVLSFLLVAGISVSVTVSCDEDVGNSLISQVRRMVHDLMRRNELIVLPFLMRCGFWPLVQW